MLDQPAATDEDARRVLESFGPTATRVNARTYRGDPVWCIESLGVELVAKHEDGTVVCVTILPPVRFRGLTSLQAEAVEVSAREAKERATEAQRQLAEAKAALAEHKAAARAVEAVSRKVKAAPIREVVQARAALEGYVAKAKHAAHITFNDHAVLLSTLKTMRQQLANDCDVLKYKAALRIAVRALLASGATEALAAIAAIEPGLASEAFANGGL